MSLWKPDGLTPLKLVRRLLLRFIEDELLTRAAALSFCFIFALFPTILSLADCPALRSVLAGADLLRGPGHPAAVAVDYPGFAGGRGGVDRGLPAFPGVSAFLQHVWKVLWFAGRSHGAALALHHGLPILTGGAINAEIEHTQAEAKTPEEREEKEA